MSLDVKLSTGKGLFVAGMCEIWRELVRVGQGGVFLQG